MSLATSLTVPTSVNVDCVVPYPNMELVPVMTSAPSEPKK